ncbi:MAG: phosphatase PAP2 family protein [Deltaproteobacteria bacterium]|nr:phosphatase PAP2 family protein [Deltaproteobacteria bacterium]
MIAETAKRLWRTDRVLVIGIAIALGLVLGFAALASNVMETETDAFDHVILRVLRTPDGEPLGGMFLKGVVVNLSALGSSTIATLIVIIASLFLILVKRRNQAIVVIACGVGTAVAIWVLKDLFGRERPNIVPHLTDVSSLSFPSGHSLIASAIYPTLGLLLSMTFKERKLKLFVFITAAMLALVIGFTRVYMGVHFPTDVLGGWMLGLAWAIVCGLICRRLQEKGIVEPEST